MDALANYGIFLLEIITVIVAVLLTVGGVMAVIAKTASKLKNEKGKLFVTKLNDKYDDMQETLQDEMLGKFALKSLNKEKKKQQKIDDKQEKKGESNPKSNVFVINFNGDVRASATGPMTEEINAILLAANGNDTVLVRLESAGGMVHGYGLAASQLQRIRDAKLKLIISVDKVAASGGYMMACVADHIIAAPFAIIGSIGVLAQLPNFHRWLDKHNVDYEQLTAGQYKRTLTMFGKNTNQAREKMQQDIDDTHELFKSFIQQHRKEIDMGRVATGEHWYATQTLEKDLKLIDEIKTSDGYLLEAKDKHDIYEVSFQLKKTLAKKLGNSAEALFCRLFKSNSQAAGQDFLP